MLRCHHNACIKSAEVIKSIKLHERQIREFGAAGIYLYGSTRHDRAGPSSDADIFIDRDPSKPFGFLEPTGLEFFLKDILDTPVDLSTRTSLHPTLRDTIERDAIRVL